MAAADAPGEVGGIVAAEGSPDDVGVVGTTGAQPPGQPGHDDERRGGDGNGDRPRPGLRWRGASKPDRTYGVVKLTHAQPTGSVTTEQPQRTGVIMAV